MILAVIVVTTTAPAEARAGVTGVVRVIDGDTIDVGTTRVRLHGIDAPEQRQTCKRANGDQWACGAWVTAQVTALFEGQTARCLEMDRDRYGRMVATCAVRGHSDMAEHIVAEGLAFAYLRFSHDYEGTEREALRRGAGLHTSRVMAPESYRRARSSSSSATAPAGCNIKGNISHSGERIFHVPGQAHYARTRINEAAGERWFCSRDLAYAAGWRAAKR